MPAAIGQDVMMEAVTGHIQRMGVTEQDFMMAFVNEHASPDEVGNAILALVDARDDGSDPAFNRGTYIAAVADGFVLGVRARRIADEKAGETE